MYNDMMLALQTSVTLVQLAKFPEEHMRWFASQQSNSTWLHKNGREGRIGLRVDCNAVDAH